MTRRPSTVPPERRISPIRKLLIGALALAALGIGSFGFAYLFLRDTPPAVVGLGDPTPRPSAAASPGAPTTPASVPPLTGGLDGRWVVDGSIGSFSDFSGSFVGYRVEEELAGIGAATAVGRTPDVTGTLAVEGTTLTSVEIVADLTGLRSDSSLRDGQLARQGIQTATFPTATFVTSGPVELDALPEDGVTMAVTVTGELTLHGVTRTVDIALEARRTGGVVTVAGSLPIVFGDYDIEKPEAARVLSVSDQAVMEFQLHFAKEPA